MPSRLVVKFGTQVVVNADGQPAKDRLEALVEGLCGLCHHGWQVVLVSSGAVGLGKRLLKLHTPLTLPEKQACAAVGQSLLIETYRHLFGVYNLVPAQILLTAADFAQRRHYLALRDTFDTLLGLGVIPVVNENDTVSTQELKTLAQNQAPCAEASFGDNDKLSALVAAKLQADALVILTNVDGIYAENPAQNPEAKPFRRIEAISQLADVQTQGVSVGGRGGMGTKLEAARLAALCGVTTWIGTGLSGQQSDGLRQFLKFLESQPQPLPPHWATHWNDGHGTLMLPQGRMPGRKRWIAWASGYQGVLVVNDGAVQALLQRHASLLPAGLLRVEGQFEAAQVVSIQDEAGNEVGRGLASQPAHVCQQWAGQPGGQALVHRDNLVIFSEWDT
jgi:glutamate 5-kinase